MSKRKTKATQRFHKWLESEDAIKYLMEPGIVLNIQDMPPDHPSNAPFSFTIEIPDIGQAMFLAVSKDMREVLDVGMHISPTNCAAMLQSRLPYYWVNQTRQ